MLRESLPRHTRTVVNSTTPVNNKLVFEFLGYRLPDATFYS